MILLFLVMMVCTAFTNEFKFNGMFLFLHMLNPVFMILYYFLFCDMNRVQKSSQVLSVMIVPLGIWKSYGGLYLFFSEYKRTRLCLLCFLCASPFCRRGDDGLCHVLSEQDNIQE